jgi:DNA-binding NarL/FixJ family response regulator
LLAQNRLLREALGRILCKTESLQVVGSCALGPDSLREIVRSAPDVFVIASFTTNMVDLEFAREVQQRLPSISLVMIGMELDSHSFLQAIREGAMGYLAKDASALGVVAAMRTVANGARFVRLSSVRFSAVLPPNRIKHRAFYVRRRLGLTNREQQLVGLRS